MTTQKEVTWPNHANYKGCLDKRMHGVSRRSLGGKGIGILALVEHSHRFVHHGFYFKMLVRYLNKVINPFMLNQISPFVFLHKTFSWDRAQLKQNNCNIDFPIDTE